MNRALCQLIAAVSVSLMAEAAFADSATVARGVVADALAKQAAATNVGFAGTYVAPPAVTPSTTPSASGTSSTSTTNSTTTNSASGNSVTNAVRDGSGVQTPVTPTGTSINPAAKQGQGSQATGKIINGVAGVAFITVCMSSKPPAYPMCIMGAMALAQAALDSGAAKESGNTAAVTDGTGNPGGYAPSPSAQNPGGSGGGGSGGPDSGSGTNPNGPAGVGGYTDPRAKAGLAALKEAGYTVTRTGVKNPDGSFTPASAFNSAAGMAAAGMSPSAIKEVMAVTAAINDEISKKAGTVSGVGLAEGGGGSGASGGGGTESEKADTTTAAGGRNPFSLNNGERKELVAGKTVLFSGEPIGVRGQDIFDMIHVAYGKKRERANFIEGDSPLVQVRTPASLPKKK